VTVEQWTVAAAASQVVAAVAAVAALIFVGVQIRVARQTADLHALQEFMKSATEREASVRDADNDQKKQQAFWEFLNFLEVNAAAFNGGLFHGKSRSIVVDKLCSSIAVIQENTAWHPLFRDAVTTTTTFAELADFMKQKRGIIEARSLELRRKTSNQP
jgi:hypothetical protein